jgi:hypothetical protein
MFTIESDIDATTRDVMNFFGDQVPFAFSRTLNDVAFQVRKEIVEVTFNRDFTVRNKSFARGLFRTGDKATKRNLMTSVGQVLDRGYIGVHASGGTKSPRGTNIAIPLSPGKVRTSTGRVASAKKPRNLKNSFFRNVNGNTILFERKKKTVEAVFVLKPDAPIKKTFDFYEDALTTATTVFSGSFDAQLDRAIRSSRFFPG